MKHNHTKFFLVGAFAFCAIAAVSCVALPVANANEESDTESDAAKDRSLFWMKTKERAEERKAQVEKNWEEKQAMMEEKKEARQEKVCTNMVERGEKMSERLGSRYEKFLERKTKRTNVFEEKREERDATLEAKRVERDGKRAEMYAKLSERAEGDVEKQKAVATFKTTVETAVSERKKSVDAAIAAFRSGVDAAIGSKKSSMDASIVAFQEAVEEAFETAKASCEAGTDPETVRKTLEASLASAKAAIADDRAAAEKVGEKVRALAETKRAAFAVAHETFKTAME